MLAISVNDITGAVYQNYIVVSRIIQDSRLFFKTSRIQGIIARENFDIIPPCKGKTFVPVLFSSYVYNISKCFYPWIIKRFYYFKSIIIRAIINDYQFKITICLI